ncbi:bifunctional aspartokinase/homoserine dehydrogenase 1-like [Panicum miliaceum]|uniref:Bifunctional aspartokinase/homoserine dehydrogenase 1-like n=1 Tax=Panicum miliaceum TaxID=4540 RepID=A0A3L6T6J8_PANMI|nr:bifunctional aspartokinase/homoserine dehydrogenase 1-like [Panicum miliaceum]
MQYPQRTSLKVVVQLDKSMEERVKAASSRGNVLPYVCEIESTGCQVCLKELPKDFALGRLRGSDNVVCYPSSSYHYLLIPTGGIYSRCYESSSLVIQGTGAGNDTTVAGVLADIIDLQDLFQKTIVSTGAVDYVFVFVQLAKGLDISAYYNF